LLEGLKEQNIRQVKREGGREGGKEEVIFVFHLPSPWLEDLTLPPSPSLLLDVGP